MPAELLQYAGDNDIQLLTHNDPSGKPAKPLFHVWYSVQIFNHYHFNKYLRLADIQELTQWLLQNILSESLATILCNTVIDKFRELRNENNKT